VNREEIIRMAMEAGMPEWLQEDWFADPFDSFAMKFANLVAAAEREACAKVCEEYQGAVDRHRWPNGYECAAAIRARREQ